MAIESGECESCGDVERDDLVAVHRLYVTPPSPDAEPRDVAEVTRPEVTRPEVTRPEVTRPEVTRPEVTRPEVTRPEVTRMAEAERWCAACRTHYPHEIAPTPF